MKTNLAGSLKAAGRLFWLAWLLVAWVRPGLAQAPAVVRTQPASLTLAPGQATVLDIVVEGASDLFGVQVRLVFDPAVMQVEDSDTNRIGLQAQPGDFLDPNQGFTVLNSIDNETGSVMYAFTLLAPAEPVSGNGLLLRLRLRGVAAGGSPLSLSATLASSDGLALPVETQDGALTVGGNPVTPVTQPTVAPPTATRPPATEPPATQQAVTGLSASATPRPPSVAPPPATRRPPTAAARSQSPSSGGSPGQAGIIGRASPTTAAARGSVPELTSQSLQATAAAAATSDARPTHVRVAAVEANEAGVSPTPAAGQPASEAVASSLPSDRIEAKPAETRQENSPQPATTLLTVIVIVTVIFAAFLVGRGILGRRKSNAP